MRPATRSDAREGNQMRAKVISRNGAKWQRRLRRNVSEDHLTQWRRGGKKKGGFGEMSAKIISRKGAKAPRRKAASEKCQRT